jgi:hypothetical protein
MPHPSHSSWLDYPYNIWCGVQIIKLLVMYSSQAYFTSMKYCLPLNNYK